MIIGIQNRFHGFFIGNDDLKITAADCLSCLEQTCGANAWQVVEIVEYCSQFVCFNSCTAVQSADKAADNGVCQSGFVVDCDLPQIPQQDTHFDDTVLDLLRGYKGCSNGIALTAQVSCYLIGSLLQLAQGQLLPNIVCNKRGISCRIDTIGTGKADSIDGKALLPGQLFTVCLRVGQFRLLRCLRLVLFQRAQIAVSTWQCRCGSCCGAA